jgi:branched-chain amino acid transport system ATP-binding protein
MSILAVMDVTKTFGGLVAVNGVSFNLEEGTITGLIGPNGAGKTTVFNLITGNYRPGNGEILFNGKSVVGLPTHRIAGLGIARTFQTIRLFQNLSILENVLAGCHGRMRSGPVGAMLRTRAVMQEERDGLARALAELDFVGLHQHVEQPAKNLSHGNQRLLEVARALAVGPQLLILDEPAGGMNEDETARLMGLISEIRKKGIAILLIEHDMRVVMKICEMIVVLDNGKKIAEGPPEVIKKNPMVIEAYLGTEEDQTDAPSY